MKIARYLEMSDDKEEVIRLQEQYAKEVIRDNHTTQNIELIAGADVCYGKRGRNAYATVIVVEKSTGNVVEKAAWEGEPSFPYKPGFLALREAPCLLNAFEKLQLTPDLVLIDGNGILHPHRFGLACHIGLSLDLPTIGCAKNLMLGKHQPISQRFLCPEIKSHGEVLGFAMKFERMHLYISIGHKVDLKIAQEILPIFSNRPMPIEYAHNVCSEMYQKEVGKEEKEKHNVKQEIIARAQQLRKEGLNYGEVSLHLNKCEKIQQAMQRISLKKLTSRKIRNWVEQAEFFKIKEK